ncbi:hypothetical protein [uncultured Senegalimassilia sp.]|uniref:hypothetical protein n=1 Tax=uncultured Senegalimassilia sp. TaxID=1714350 RepID=UPI002069BCC7|nr:hypothetical protein [uncultured Senegalimassilia sp.]DAG14717.1 MAG TPA: hypothetical protein [Caudoviricetes sp.]
MMQIPKRLLRDRMVVLLPDPEADYAGEYAERREVRGVLFQSKAELGRSSWSLADGASGRVYIDAQNSQGAFAPPVGARVEVSGPGIPDTLAMEVKACAPYCGLRGLHHWEVDAG